MKKTKSCSTKLRILGKRRLRQIHRQINKYWNRSSGDWRWLQEKPLPVAAINRHLWRSSVPSFSFHFLLAMSSIIATLGLLANNVAVIIGAMIIAPLIGPIVGVAYSMVIGNRRLLRRSLLTLLTGISLTVFVSFFTTHLVGLRNLNAEITARANPTLIDLGVALAAGAAGSFATSRRRIADALPGVAIAVALVPPLSVVGIGVALGFESIASQSLLLFLTNLTGIIFSSSLVFLLQRYGNLERARQGLFVSTSILLILGLPLGFSLNKLLLKQNVHSSVSVLIRRRTLTFSETDIRFINVNLEDDILNIEIEVAAPANSISDKQVSLVRDFIQQQLQRPINLTVRVLPVEVIETDFTLESF
ncbi:MAG: TIGR00341 family protein [Jaaginema sp. PMC 1079.18]|nr:TIGR00341 family protein [Jaaginema sp. PMC 1080.18]MEC4851488.1 TIGR00341 family protein [Jaaginema sp. PMC 1079.18]MEC4866955.1 TIGR00341 family protein [Jaaginema sp. PMC 1078.18]